MFDGHETDGFVVSLTVTVKVQVPVLPDASVAVQVTVVEPRPKLDPEGGVHETVVLPAQLSLPVGVV